MLASPLKYTCMEYYIIFYIYYSISCTCKVCEFVSYIFNSIFIYFIIRMSSILKSSIQAFNARQIQLTHSFAYANFWGKIKNNSSYFPSRCIRQQANSSKMRTQWLYLSHALYFTSESDYMLSTHVGECYSFIAAGTSNQVAVG